MEVKNQELALAIAATKPRGKPAVLLAEQGITVHPIDEDEGNVDRYVLSRRLAVERRTGGTFLRGIEDKTLFTSAIYLREHFKIPVLIVEGETEDAHRAFSPQAIRGALASMVIRYGLSVLSTPDVQGTVALLAMMARQEQLGIADISTIPKRQAADLPDLQRRVIEMLPGCGMVMARNLLQRLGSVRRIVNATEEELCEVGGIGAVRAAEIHRMCNAEYASIDTERDLEDAVEAAPDLLFEGPVTLLARQHTLYSDGGERQVIDLVFLDDRAGELILVELKRGRLVRQHEEQLRHYLDQAHRSSLLRPLLDGGLRVRGIVATAAECAFEPRREGITACIVDAERARQVLVGLWRARRASIASQP
ncbi:MAG: hypothetical protein ISS56_19475 [Anaerolineae bacterium]|nr:hypothetical protein [Anaerolineae bacterium]